MALLATRCRFVAKRVLGDRNRERAVSRLLSAFSQNELD
jgi:hypothetical protein